MGLEILTRQSARIAAVFFAAVFVSVILVLTNLVRADDLDVVPYLFAGYLAFELFYRLRRKPVERSSKE